jgi:hypothetical protein
VTLPSHVRNVVPVDTADTWEAIADVVPAKAYLVGGTALAIHFRHRVSRDLDFFLEEPIDVGKLVDTLQRRGPFVTTMREDHSPQTLNGVFRGTKLQFLEASSQVLLERPGLIGGVRVAGVADLLATKLNVLTHRPALRDYVDLMIIERDGNRFVEEGLALFVEKYQPTVPDQAIRLVLECLASLRDVEADPELTFLPGARALTKVDVARYWSRRIPEVVAHLARGDLEQPGSERVVPRGPGE